MLIPMMTTTARLIATKIGIVSLIPLDGSDADLDQDGDGLTNLQEQQSGTLPDNPDSDGDGVNDGVDYYPTDPNRSQNPYVKLDATGNDLPDDATAWTCVRIMTAA